MSLDAEAIDQIKQLAVTAAEKRVITDNNGNEFVVSGDSVDYFAQPELDRSRVKLATLDSLIDFLKVDENTKYDKLYVHVERPDLVVVYTTPDEFGRRKLLATVKPELSTFKYDNWLNQETMIIGLQTNFVADETTDLQAVLQFVSALTYGQTHVSADDGVTQETTIKAGVTLKGEGKVPNPVNLRPYRTFYEVAQPASEFILRARNDDNMYTKLIPTGDETWRGEARSNVKQYLLKNEGLTNLVKSGKLLLLA